jgi:hypothetical protein
VRDVRVQLQPLRRRARLVYFPAYIVQYTFGEVLAETGERRPQHFMAVISGMGASDCARIISRNKAVCSDLPSSGDDASLRLSLLATGSLALAESDSGKPQVMGERHFNVRKAQLLAGAAVGSSTLATGAIAAYAFGDPSATLFGIDNVFWVLMSCTTAGEG